MFNFINRSVLRDGEPGAAGGGTGSPGGQAGTPGTGSFDPSKFVSTEDFGKTAAMIRGIQKSLETLSAGTLTADKLAEIGLIEKGEDGSYKPKTSSGKPAGKDGKDGEPAPWEHELNKLKAQLRAKDEEIAGERRKMEEAERRQAVIAALNKGGAVNAERDHVHLLSSVVKGESGFVVKGKDKYGSEIDVPLDEHVASWLKDNPDLLKAQAGSGTGIRPGQGAGGNNGTVVPKSTWSNMEWYMANRDKIIKGEIQLGQ